MSENQEKKEENNKNVENKNEDNKQLVEKKVIDFIKPEIAAQLQEMGFSKNVSEKACLFTGSNLEAAVEWISQHQEDPDFEEEAKIEVKEEKPMDPELAKIKAREYQEKMRKIHQEKEKEMEREHEKMRIHNIKEMQKAQAAEKEREALLYVEQRKRQEKEDAMHRAKVLEEMEKDKAERLGKKYVPKSEQVQKEYTKEDNIISLIKAIKNVYNPYKCGNKMKNCFDTIKIFLNNVLKNPNEQKFKRIKLTNPTVNERVGSISLAVKLLEELGFIPDDSKEFMNLNQDYDINLFNKTIKYMDDALDLNTK